MTSSHEQGPSQEEATPGELYAPFKLVEGLVNQGERPYAPPLASEGVLDGVNIVDEVPSIALLDLSGSQVRELSLTAAAELLIEPTDKLLVRYNPACYVQTERGRDYMPAQAYFEARHAGVEHTYAIDVDQREAGEDGTPTVITATATTLSNPKERRFDPEGEHEVDQARLDAVAESMVALAFKHGGEDAALDDDYFGVAANMVTTPLTSDQANALNEIMTAYTFNRIVGQQ